MDSSVPISFLGAYAAREWQRTRPRKNVLSDSSPAKVKLKAGISTESGADPSRAADQQNPPRSVKEDTNDFDSNSLASVPDSSSFLVTPKTGSLSARDWSPSTKDVAALPMPRHQLLDLLSRNERAMQSVLREKNEAEAEILILHRKLGETIKSSTAAEGLLKTAYQELNRFKESANENAHDRKVLEERNAALRQQVEELKVSASTHSNVAKEMQSLRRQLSEERESRATVAAENEKLQITLLNQKTDSYSRNGEFAAKSSELERAHDLILKLQAENTQLKHSFRQKEDLERIGDVARRIEIADMNDDLVSELRQSNSLLMRQLKERNFQYYEEESVLDSLDLSISKLENALLTLLNGGGKLLPVLVSQAQRASVRSLRPQLQIDEIIGSPISQSRSIWEATSVLAGPRDTESLTNSRISKKPVIETKAANTIKYSVNARIEYRSKPVAESNGSQRADSDRNNGKLATGHAPVHTLQQEALSLFGFSNGNISDKTKILSENEDSRVDKDWNGFGGDVELSVANRVTFGRETGMSDFGKPELHSSPRGIQNFASQPASSPAQRQIQSTYASSPAAVESDMHHSSKKGPPNMYGLSEGAYLLAFDSTEDDQFARYRKAASEGISPPRYYKSPQQSYTMKVFSAAIKDITSPIGNALTSLEGLRPPGLGKVHSGSSAMFSNRSNAASPPYNGADRSNNGRLKYGALALQKLKDAQATYSPSAIGSKFVSSPQERSAVWSRGSPGKVKVTSHDGRLLELDLADDIAFC